MLRALASSPVVVESPLEKKNLRGSRPRGDRKSTRLNSSHDQISYAVFCLKKKKINYATTQMTASGAQLSTSLLVTNRVAGTPRHSASSCRPSDGPRRRDHTRPFLHAPENA